MKVLIIALAASAILAARSEAQAVGTMTREQKIANAMKAAPASISANATIKDWPAMEGSPAPVLREGSNGWTCFPDVPATQGNDPMCLDATWMEWMTAYLQKQPPAITRIGFGYMVAPGGAWGSNTDPYATARTADNEWGIHGPHIMVLLPGPDALAAYPTDPAAGGPWLMWRGTPYAHIMVPLGPAQEEMKKP